MPTRVQLPLVMMALVCGGTLNSSAANFRTAVNGAPSGTLKLIGKRKKQQPRDQSQANQTRKLKKKSLDLTYTLKGSLGSEVRVTLKETFPPVAIFSDEGGDQISTAKMAFFDFCVSSRFYDAYTPKRVSSLV